MVLVGEEVAKSLGEKGSGTRTVGCGKQRWWWGRAAGGQVGKWARRDEREAAGGAPAALWPDSPGRGLRAQPGSRGPAPRALFRGAHPPERHSWARRPAPWGRLAAGPAAPGRWAARLPALDPWEPSLAGGGEGAGNRPGAGGGGRVQMGRGPRAPADGCEAGLGPCDKGPGQMFAARCSRDGGSLGKLRLLSRRPPPAAAEGVPRARCGWGVRRRGRPGRGRRGGSKGFSGKVVYFSPRPQPSHSQAVKRQGGIWAERPARPPFPASLGSWCGRPQVEVSVRTPGATPPPPS